MRRLEASLAKLLRRFEYLHELLLCFYVWDDMYTDEMLLLMASLETCLVVGEWGETWNVVGQLVLCGYVGLVLSRKLQV